MEPHRQARPSRPQFSDNYIAYQPRHYGQFADLSFAVGENNGITRTEIAEIITHIGFFTPVGRKLWAAFRLAKDVWAAEASGKDAKEAFQNEMIFPIGEPNTDYAKYFYR